MRARGGSGLLTAASVVVVVAGLKAASFLMVPFMLAIFLTILSLPLHRWLSRRIHPGAAVVVTVLANLLFVVGLVALVSGSVSGFVEAAPRYRLRVEALATSSIAWLDARGVPTAEWLDAQNVGLDGILDLVGSTLRGLTAVLTNLLLVVLTMIFLLLEVDRLPAKLQSALDVSPSQYALYVEAAATVQRYLVVKTCVSGLTGLAIFLGTWLVGLDFPVLWGLLAFLFNYIPSLGSIIASVPAILLAMVTLGPGPALAVGVIYLVANVAFGNLLEPHLLGRQLGLSPLVIFVSLVFWGWAWGPVGMLLSVPLTVVARIFLEKSEELGWVAILLAARPPRSPVDAAGS